MADAADYAAQVFFGEDSAQSFDQGNPSDSDGSWNVEDIASEAGPDFEAPDEPPAMGGGPSSSGQPQHHSQSQSRSEDGQFSSSDDFEAPDEPPAIRHEQEPGPISNGALPEIESRATSLGIPADKVNGWLQAGGNELANEMLNSYGTAIQQQSQQQFQQQQQFSPQQQPQQPQEQPSQFPQMASLPEWNELKLELPTGDVLDEIGITSENAERLLAPVAQVYETLNKVVPALQGQIQYFQNDAIAHQERELLQAFESGIESLGENWKPVFGAAEGRAPNSPEDINTSKAQDVWLDFLQRFPNEQPVALVERAAAALFPSHAGRVASQKAKQQIASHGQKRTGQTVPRPSRRVATPNETKNDPHARATNRIAAKLQEWGHGQRYSINV
jgi:hypothetical protein